jgi:hypothetical protein
MKYFVSTGMPEIEADNPLEAATVFWRLIHSEQENVHIVVSIHPDEPRDVNLEEDIIEVPIKEMFRL